MKKIMKINKLVEFFFVYLSIVMIQPLYSAAGLNNELGKSSEESSSEESKEVKMTQQDKLKRLSEEQKKAISYVLGEDALGKVVKPCPYCLEIIEKRNGCDIMECITCGGTFCWGCGYKEPKKGGHDHLGGINGDKFCKHPRVWWR